MRSFAHRLTILAAISLIFMFTLPSPASGQDVRASTSAPDSTGRSGDSLNLSAGRPGTDTLDTLAGKDLKSVRTAMLLSLFVPGGGQFYNESYWKGGIIAAAEIAFASLTVREHLLLMDIEKTLPSGVPDSIKENLITSYRDRRNAFAFLTGAVIIYALSDAYVDSHMFHFREQQRLSLVPADRGLGIALRLNF